MLSEYENLVPTEKEMELRVFINQLTNNLYSNEKIEVDSKKLLELLSYLTSNENMSTQMKSALEYQNSRITDILHKKEVDHLKEHIKYLEENSITKQKVKDKIKRHKFAKKEFEKEYGNKNYKDDDLRTRDFYMIVAEDLIIKNLQELMEDK